MKVLPTLMTALLLLPSLSFAASNRQSSEDVYVGGYTKSNGTQVQPYYRSAPNANQWDNYNYKPSQPQYNTSEAYSTKTTPNPGRLNDSNPYNDAPSGYIGR